MTDTLTYDPTPADAPELSEEEQSSLEVAEKLGEEEGNLLAGKYKNAEELEKAYTELEKKLGERSDESKAETETESEDTPSISPNAQLITSASEEFENSGELTSETLEKLSSVDSKDLIQAYLELQSSNPEESAEPSQVADLSDADVNQIKTSAGGEESYQKIIDWASNNLEPNAVQAFDNIVNSGSVEAIQLAVNGLKAQYENANGYEGKMITGKAPQNSRDVFRSQAELVAAMSDRRYDQDPAYRQDVIAKLERSENLQF